MRLRKTTYSRPFLYKLPSGCSFSFTFLIDVAFGCRRKSDDSDVKNFNGGWSGDENSPIAPLVVFFRKSSLAVGNASSFLMKSIILINATRFPCLYDCNSKSTWMTLEDTLLGFWQDVRAVALWRRLCHMEVIDDFDFC